MLGFRFLDEVYNSSKQNYKILTIKNLYADIISDGIKIGEVQCYYLNSCLLDIKNLDLFQFYLNSLDKEDQDLYYNEGFYDEEEYEKYSEENFFSEGEYKSFLEDNNLEKIDDYIRNKKDILFIKDLKLNKQYDFSSLIEELRNNLYMLFDYKDFLIMDCEENKIG